jgi:integrase
MKLPKFPRRLTNGVVIYHVQNGAYAQFRVASYDSTGRRRFQVFSTYDEANKVAGQINGSVAQGDVDAIVLTGAQKVEYTRARDILKPLELSLDMAAQQLAEAAKLIPGGSVLEAVRYYAKRNPTKLPRRTVAEVVAEFTTAKERAGRSQDYLTDIRYRCGRFAVAFQCGVNDVSCQDIRRFLDSLNLSGRSVNNFRLLIGTFFEFAKARGYLPKDWDELAGVEDVDEAEGKIEIYTPAEMLRLLNAAPPDFLPVLAIGAFAGLRAKELERLEWSEVQVARGFIEVKASKAKTAARRLVPILPNLAQWLAPYAQHTGKVWAHSEAGFEKRKSETAARTASDTQKAVPWRHNALRHSFISYRVAGIQNVNQVALEAGNSSQIIFANYRELVTPDDARAWFSICPGRAANVMMMTAAAAS